MQPNDDRGMAQLDPELDSHIIATSGYEGFPAFITGNPYDDTVANAVVPNLIGMNLSQVGDALTSAGLVGSQSNTGTGATALNSGLVKSQSIAPDTVVNAGTTVPYVSYLYVSPANPIAGLTTNVGPETPALNPGEILMYLVGRTVKPTVGEVIKILGNTNDSLNQGYNVLSVNDDDSYNTGGTVVLLMAFEKAYADPNTNSGGTWQDYFA